MGYVVQGVNMVSSAKCALLVDPALIDEQDMAGLELLLKEKVCLAPSDVTIYIQITEKMLKKKAKAAIKC